MAKKLVSSENLEQTLSILKTKIDAKVPLNLLKVENTISAKEMSILAQNNAKIYVDNNGTPSKVSLNDLDYSKITVIEKNGSLNNVRTNDFVFEKGDS